MLAYERRLARIILMDAYRTPRTSRFNTIMAAGENLKQLPRTNGPLHADIFNVTYESHYYIDKEADEMVKWQQK